MSDNRRDVEYTVGFAFNLLEDQVALVLKNRPGVQAGKLNGVGGKIETGETPHECMVREFQEETGFTQTQWKPTLTMTGPDYKLHFFMAYIRQIALTEIVRKTADWDEPIQLVKCDALPNNLVTNLNWLIPMHRHGFPQEAIEYGGS